MVFLLKVNVIKIKPQMDNGHLHASRLRRETLLQRWLLNGGTPLRRVHQSPTVGNPPAALDSPHSSVLQMHTDDKSRVNLCASVVPNIGIRL
ncbi:hypothetical protein SD81_020135 [Tolypothrix campylonemoides VB511288]|nr:hypothetical protein SD81_020135 [Tolypothrix campylonemoides VB511288]